MLRRFVFLVSQSGDEVLHGSTTEIRAWDETEAVQKTAEWLIVKEGATMTLIGERVGWGSGRRFVPHVALAEVPTSILQNEVFVGCLPDGREAEGERTSELARRAA